MWSDAFRPEGTNTSRLFSQEPAAMAPKNTWARLQSCSCRESDRGVRVEALWTTSPTSATADVQETPETFICYSLGRHFSNVIPHNNCRKLLYQCARFNSGCSRGQIITFFLFVCLFYFLSWLIGEAGAKTFTEIKLLFNCIPCKRFIGRLST